VSTCFSTPGRLAALLATTLCLPLPPAQAGDEVKALLEILLEKGILTQAEYDAKIRKAQEAEEIRAFNEAQDVRRANREIDKRAEEERKFKTQIYGQVSAGYYDASNMKSGTLDASGVADQPKGNNRVGLRVTKELDADVSAVLTLESNLSLRTGAIGKDAGSSGANNAGTNNGPVFDREANLRLISKDYGTLIIGRGANFQNELSGTYDARQNWNFGGLKPIARYAGFHSASGINRADRMIRYISPTFQGFTFDGGLSIGGVPGDSGKNAHVYAGAKYKQDGFEAAYHHISASLSSTSSSRNNVVDFIAAKYAFGSLTLSGGYVFTRNPLNPSATLSTLKPEGQANVDTAFAGALYRFTPKLSANAGWYLVKDKSSTAGLNDVRMFATGLTYSPYKDWDVFIDYVTADRKANATAVFSIYDSWRPDTSSPSTLSAGTRDQSGLAVGAQFKF
jgi:predicted porin